MSELENMVKAHSLDMETVISAHDRRGLIPNPARPAFQDLLQSQGLASISRFLQMGFVKETQGQSRGSQSMAVTSTTDNVTSNVTLGLSGGNSEATDKIHARLTFVSSAYRKKENEWSSTTKHSSSKGICSPDLDKLDQSRSTNAVSPAADVAVIDRLHSQLPGDDMAPWAKKSYAVTAGVSDAQSKDEFHPLQAAYAPKQNAEMPVGSDERRVRPDNDYLPGLRHCTEAERGSRRTKVSILKTLPDGTLVKEPVKEYPQRPRRLAGQPREQRSAPQPEPRSQLQAPPQHPNQRHHQPRTQPEPPRESQKKFVRVRPDNRRPRKEEELQIWDVAANDGLKKRQNSILEGQPDMIAIRDIIAQRDLELAAGKHLDTGVTSGETQTRKHLGENVPLRIAHNEGMPAALRFLKLMRENLEERTGLQARPQTKPAVQRPSSGSSEIWGDDDSIIEAENPQRQVFPVAGTTSNKKDVPGDTSSSPQAAGTSKTTADKDEASSSVPLSDFSHVAVMPDTDDTSDNFKSDGGAALPPHSRQGFNKSYEIPDEPRDFVSLNQNYKDQLPPHLRSHHEAELAALRKAETVEATTTDKESLPAWNFDAARNSSTVEPAVTSVSAQADLNARRKSQDDEPSATDKGSSSAYRGNDKAQKSHFPESAASNNSSLPPHLRLAKKSLDEMGMLPAPTTADTSLCEIGILPTAALTRAQSQAQGDYLHIPYSEAAVRENYILPSPGTSFHPVIQIQNFPPYKTMKQLETARIHATLPPKIQAIPAPKYPFAPPAAPESDPRLTGKSPVAARPAGRLLANPLDPANKSTTSVYGKASVGQTAAEPSQEDLPSAMTPIRCEESAAASRWQSFAQRDVEVVGCENPDDAKNRPIVQQLSADWDRRVNADAWKYGDRGHLRVYYPDPVDYEMRVKWIGEWMTQQWVNTLCDPLTMDMTTEGFLTGHLPCTGVAYDYQEFPPDIAYNPVKIYYGPINWRNFETIPLIRPGRSTRKRDVCSNDHIDKAMEKFVDEQRAYLAAEEERRKSRRAHRSEKRNKPDLAVTAIDTSKAITNDNPWGIQGRISLRHVVTKDEIYQMVRIHNWYVSRTIETPDVCRIRYGEMCGLLDRAAGEGYPSLIAVLDVQPGDPPVSKALTGDHRSQTSGEHVIGFSLMRSYTGLAPGAFGDVASLQCFVSPHYTGRKVAANLLDRIIGCVDGDYTSNQGCEITVDATNLWNGGWRRPQVIEMNIFHDDYTSPYVQGRKRFLEHQLGFKEVGNAPEFCYKPNSRTRVSMLTLHREANRNGTYEHLDEDLPPPSW